MLSASFDGLQARKPAWRTCGSKLASALFAGILLAATVPVATAADAPPPGPPPPTAEGTTWRTIVGDKFVDKSGINVDFILQTGFSESNTGAPAAGGTQNYPNGEPGDLGWNTSGMWMIMHKDLKANIIPRITPIPPPMSKHWDWGFEQDLVYGRDSQPCRMAGWDAQWGVNEPGADTPSAAAANKSNFLCTPNVFASIYIPVFKGITLTGGRYGDGLGYEIPPTVTHGPNFFYSHTNAFYSQTWQVLGFLVSANLMHSPKNGYLVAEFGMNNGEQTAKSPNGNTMQAFEGALRWKAPHMNTGFNYAFRVQDGNLSPANAASKTNFGPLYPLVSAKSLTKQRHEVNITHEFDKHLSIAVEGAYYNQAGSPTSAIAMMPWAITSLGVAPFTGAHAWGINGTAIYRFNHKVAVGFRAEEFYDKKGYFMLPLNFWVGPTGPTLSKGHFDNFTAGVNYSPVKWVLIRPEYKYDWNNSGAYGTTIPEVASGAKKPLNSQQMFNMDFIIRF